MGFVFTVSVEWAQEAPAPTLPLSYLWEFSVCHMASMSGTLIILEVFWNYVLENM